MLGCTLHAHKAYTCPPSRLKREPGVSNRDIKGLMDEESDVSEIRSQSDPPSCAENREKVIAVFALGETEVTGGTDVRQAHQVPRESGRGVVPHLRLEVSHSLGPGASMWEVSPTRRVFVKQALARPGRCREQNSHLEGPDHAVGLLFFISLLLILCIHKNVRKLLTTVLDSFSQRNFFLF